MPNPDVLHTYWQGVLARLQAEVENMNQLIGHQGVKGAENEASLMRIVTQMIPTRYAVGAGLVIDSSGNSSKQMDIIVYDKGRQPSLLAQTTQVLFPVETVQLCIEVKTSVGSGEVRDAREKNKSLRDLQSTSTYPAFCLFGYQAVTYPESIAKNLSEAMTGDGPRPDFVCIPDVSFIAYADKERWISALTPLLKDGNAETSEDRWDTPTATENDAYTIRNGRRFPIVKAPDEFVLGDPSRALLLFAEQVISATDKNAAAIMRAYLREGLRKCVEL